MLMRYILFPVNNMLHRRTGIDGAVPGDDQYLMDTHPVGQLLPFADTGRKEIAAWELGVLLEGIDLSKVRRRKRYSLPAVAATNTQSEETKEKAG